MEKVSGMTMKTNVLNMANEAQRQAIETTEGPLLITAGPGTGKTFTLVQRAIYLMQKRVVRPEEIFLATFTEKAQKGGKKLLEDYPPKRSLSMVTGCLQTIQIDGCRISENVVRVKVGEIAKWRGMLLLIFYNGVFVTYFISIN